MSFVFIFFPLDSRPYGFCFLVGEKKRFSRLKDHMFQYPCHYKIFSYSLEFVRLCETKRKYANQQRFLYKICYVPSLYSNWRVSPIEFNSYKVSFVRYEFVEIFGLFWVRPKWLQNDPKWPQDKLQTFLIFNVFYVFMQFVKICNKLRGLDEGKQSTRAEIVVQ